MADTQFPKGFLWGAGTASHQVEGGTANDWSEWEKANAERLAREAEAKFGHSPAWNDFKTQAQDPRNYISGDACDFYHRYEQDFDIARSLGHTAHRFSIEWSRIEPREGEFDEHAIEYYKKMIAALRARGMEPFVTLWHWPLPLWLRDKGGWRSKKAVGYFARYVKVMVSALGNDVRFWITLNEPEIYPMNGYLRGVWPPQEKSFFRYFSVTRNLAHAHRRAYEDIKKINPDAQVGIAKHNVYFEAADGKLVNRVLKWCADQGWNFHFLNKIKDAQDFIGLNHYFHNRIDYGFNKNENKKVSDMGWELYPEAMYYVLTDLKKYNKPIYITENGLADAKDANREWFIKESLSNVARAMQDGADVRGYLHWGLTDFFEWDKGFWPRFGLVAVDYATMTRTIRPSAWKYKEIIERGAV